VAKSSKIMEAIYSEGVFKPLGKVSLSEGEKVEIEIKERKVKEVISLRGIWKGVEITEEDIERAKNMKHKLWGHCLIVDNVSELF